MRSRRVDRAAAAASILTGVLVDAVPLTALLDAQALVYIVCGLLTRLGLVRRPDGIAPPQRRRADEALEIQRLADPGLIMES